MKRRCESACENGCPDATGSRNKSEFAQIEERVHVVKVRSDGRASRPSALEGGADLQPTWVAACEAMTTLDFP